MLAEPNAAALPALRCQTRKGQEQRDRPHRCRSTSELAQPKRRRNLLLVSFIVETSFNFSLISMFVEHSY